LARLEAAFSVVKSGYKVNKIIYLDCRKSASKLKLFFISRDTLRYHSSVFEFKFKYLFKFIFIFHALNILRVVPQKNIQVFILSQNSLIVLINLCSLIQKIYLKFLVLHTSQICLVNLLFRKINSVNIVARLGQTKLFLFRQRLLIFSYSVLGTVKNLVIWILYLVQNQIVQLTQKIPIKTQSHVMVNLTCKL
jgi:hypothetical protein